MRADTKICSALACACTASRALAFVPHISTTVAAELRPKHGLQAYISSVAPNARGSFRGMSVIPTGSSAGSRVGRATKRGRSARGRSMGMLFNDTILGVGTPEVLVILVVGYFVLGPIELFKFTKQAGVLLGQLKDIGLGTATNLGQIMEEQVRQAEMVASGELPLPVNPENIYPSSDDDEYEDIVVDEYGRVVADEIVRPPPDVPDDKEPFWSSLKPESFGLEEGGEGPLKKATKFTEQLSGQVNANVMAREKESMSGGDLGSGVDDWPGVKTTSGAGTASNAGAEFGMGRPWAPDDIDTDNKLTNDVPAELSIDEQFERLDKIASLEEERALTMQRLEARIDAKIGAIKSELLGLVDEDFQEKRARVNREFLVKNQANDSAVAQGAKTGEPNVNIADGDIEEKDANISQRAQNTADITA